MRVQIFQPQYNGVRRRVACSCTWAMQKSFSFNQAESIDTMRRGEKVKGKGRALDIASQVRNRRGAQVLGKDLATRHQGEM